MGDNIKALLVYMVSLISKMTIYLAQKAQIILFIAKKVTILTKYAEFINIFSKKSTKVLLKQTSIHGHTIKLVDNKQLLSELIYSLKLVELKALKIYIKTTLANSFIWPFKSSNNAFILFFCKLNSSLCLNVNF